MGEAISPFDRLHAILDVLRQECPWDRVQTIESLRYLTLEEVYELSDAILAQVGQGDDVSPEVAADNLKKELGDLLMHILFYSKIAQDEHLFSFDDVCTAICDKLVSRHPHIALPLSDGSIRPPLTSDHPGWEQVKMREGRKSVLEGVPSGLPALVKAIRLQEKAAGMGYQEPDDIAAKTFLQDDAAPSASIDATVAGDLLFSLVSWLRRQGVNADEALSLANERFVGRVRHWEQEHSQTL